MTGVLVDRVLFEGKRAVGVSTSRGEFRSQGEVIVSAGGLISPQILQRSGIGASAPLRDLRVDVVAESPGVGAHLLEHRLLWHRYDISVPHSQNLELAGWRLVANVLRYYLTRSGPLSVAYGNVAAFARVLPDAKTPDAEILLSPATTEPDAAGNQVLDTRHSVQIFGYPLRSRSEGDCTLPPPTPPQPPRIRPGFLTDPYDCAVTVAMHRYIRRWMQQPAIAPMVEREKEPGASLQTDEQILDAYRRTGQAGLHACGTCRMGDFPDAVLDDKLRVRGSKGCAWSTAR
jgi:choline dehydrogenase-like flavoprotein